MSKNLASKPLQRGNEIKGRARSQLGNHEISLVLVSDYHHKINTFNCHPPFKPRRSAKGRVTLGTCKNCSTMLEYRVVSSGTSMGLDNSSTRRMLNDMEASNASASGASVNGNTASSVDNAAPLSVLESSMSTHMDPCRTTVLACTRGGDVLWRSRVSGFGSLIAGNRRFSALGTTAGEIYLFTPAGRCMAPPMMMPEPLAFLECCSYVEKAVALKKRPLAEFLWG